MFRTSPPGSSHTETTTRGHRYSGVKRAILAPSRVGLRINHKLFSLTFSCIHGSAPQYRSELIPLYTPSRSLRFSSQSLLSIPGYYGTTVFALLRMQPQSCATVPRRRPTLKTSSLSVQSFRRCLKTFPPLQLLSAPCPVPCRYEHAMHGDTAVLTMKWSSSNIWLTFEYISNSLGSVCR